MKSLLITFALLIFSPSAFSAFSIEPISSQPIQSAKMDVITAYGIFEEVQNVYLEKWSHALQQIVVNSDDLNKSRYSYKLYIEDQELELEVWATFRGSCGSTVIRLKAVGSSTGDIIPDELLNITLVDHKTRLCDDYRKYLWELDVELIDNMNRANNGKLTVGGNPQAVHNIFAQ